MNFEIILFKEVLKTVFDRNLKIIFLKIEIYYLVILIIVTLLVVVMITAIFCHLIWKNNAFRWDINKTQIKLKTEKSKQIKQRTKRMNGNKIVNKNAKLGAELNFFRVDPFKSDEELMKPNKVSNIDESKKDELKVLFISDPD